MTPWHEGIAGIMEKKYPQFKGNLFKKILIPMCLFNVLWMILINWIEYVAEMNLFFKLKSVTTHMFLIILWGKKQTEIAVASAITLILE